MAKYEYVTKKEYQPVKDQLIKLINFVQDKVREDFTFRFDFIGSSSRNMITRQVNGNIGYDFDVNIRVNDDENKYTEKQIKEILMNGFNKCNHSFGYDSCENNTRVFTIKVKDKKNSRILHSCDFAVVYDCSDGRQLYIRFNKNQQSYYWEYQPEGYYHLPQKIDEIKRSGLWQEVRDLYLEKKNNNTNPDKKSRAIFAETINEIYQKHFAE